MSSKNVLKTYYPQKYKLFLKYFRYIPEIFVFANILIKKCYSFTKVWYDETSPYPTYLRYSYNFSTFPTFECKLHSTKYTPII